MAEFSLYQLMRTGHVKRWQIVRTAREQTIAEHMYRVWLITDRICGKLKAPDALTIRAVTWALVHDIPEVITGDIATPMKAAMREAVPDNDPIKRIELSLSDDYRRIWSESKLWVSPDWPTAYELVKLADLLEARMFLGCEMLGNHAKEVYDGLGFQIEDLLDVYIAKYSGPDWNSIRCVIDDSWRKV